jgi:heptosyltransferase-2
VTEKLRIVVLAPNWLGDCVMALPAIADVRARYPGATLAVAAREHLAPLFTMVEGVDEVVSLEYGSTGHLFRSWASAWNGAARLRDGHFDTAILLPNSFRAAWMTRRAGIAERWGYATDARAIMLTRALPREPGGHQVDYYQRLVRGLGIPTAEPSIALQVPEAVRERGRALLDENGWRADEPLVGMAPGAAYGTAKQWPPERFGALAAELAREGFRTVLVGSRGDRATCLEVESAAREALGAADVAAQDESHGTAAATEATRACINLAGSTDLQQLAGVLGECCSFVTNDSGAMHVAAAVGVPVTAIFGSTNEKETAPMPIATPRRDWPFDSGRRGVSLRVNSGGRPVQDSGSGELTRAGARGQGSQGARAEGRHAEHVIIATDVACRPCMLRECRYEHHACMMEIDVPRVKAAVLAQVSS